MVLSQTSSGPRDLWEAPLRGRGVSGPFPTHTKAQPREELGSFTNYVLIVFSLDFRALPIPPGG